LSGHRSANQNNQGGPKGSRIFYGTLIILNGLAPGLYLQSGIKPTPTKRDDFKPGSPNSFSGLLRVLSLQPLPPDRNSRNTCLRILIYCFIQLPPLGGDGMDTKAGKVGKGIGFHDGKE
jgi:hypothetical protein